MTIDYSEHHWTLYFFIIIILVPQHTGGWSQHARLENTAAAERKRGVSGAWQHLS